MTWRGTMRSLAAAARRAEREAQRQRRALLKQQQAMLKAAAQTQAALEVQLHEADLSRLVTLHQECSDDWDWEALSTIAPPPEPLAVDAATKGAEAALDGYVASFFDRVLRREAGTRAALAKSVEDARRHDAAATRKARDEHQKDYSEWEKLRTIATGIRAGELSAYT